MSLLHSPQITTNGLLLYFDANNIKSYNIGPNYLPNSSLVGNWSVNGNAIRTANASIAPDGTNTAVRFDTSQTFSGVYLFFNAIAGNTYTYSIYLKYVTGNGVIAFGSDGGVAVGTVLFNANTGIATLSSGSPFNITSTNVGNGWYRVSFSLIAGSTGIQPIIVYAANSNYNSFLAWGPQVEKSTYPGTYVAKSSTPTAWTDIITGKVATLANSAVLSNDAIYFNGTTSYANFSISELDFSAEQTIMMGLMPDENDANRRNPYNNNYGGYGTITHESDGTFNYYWGIAGADNIPYAQITSTTTVLQNEKAIVTVSRGPLTAKWYKNGILDVSATNPYPVAVLGSTTATIGNGYAGYYSGNIYFLLMYNRQLSDTEVLQNYNALKGRLGL